MLISIALLLVNIATVAIFRHSLRECMFVLILPRAAPSSPAWATGLKPPFGGMAFEH